ncbi:hypothetical protein [Undibacterium sp. Di24W]|uniref:hypothetical protein n=1 Tax=Undibacterium sp. Di24W TaxID=3413033 RepID=UPI003BF44242
MAYSIYALLSKDSPEITLSSLLGNLRLFFSKTDESVFIFELEEDPFDESEKNILVTWDDKWWIRFFYDEGPDVAQDSIEISKMLKSNPSPGIDNIDRRISVLFGDDESKTYTNHVIFTIDFLQEIPGVLLIDLRKKCIL